MPRADLKRTLDVTGSLLALCLLAPLLLGLVVGVRLTSRGPALFRQLRVGRGGRTFVIHKFRTMQPDAQTRLADVMALNLHPAGPGGVTTLYKISGDPRVTRFGAFLRRHSLDELPQFYDVLIGHMSLVGPRPLTPDEDRWIADRDRDRWTVRPGITGPWQVGGRNDLSFEAMIELDRAYVRGRSIRGDLGLLLRTGPAVLRRQPDC